MDTIGWEPPGKGPWELEATHFARPVSRFTGPAFCEGFVKGFSEGTARYGVLLDHLEPGLANGFMYNQPVAFGAPKGAMGPPPKPVLWLLTRLHPKMRARIATSARAFDERQWRADLAQWDEVDRPAAIDKHRAIQAVDPARLSDEELAAHVERCRRHLAAMIYLHHRYTITSTVVTGDLLAGVAAWTDVTPGEALGLLQGTSQISRGFAAAELDAAAKAITTSDPARSLLAGSVPADAALAGLCDDPVAGPDVRAYLDAVRYRSVGYDVADANAGELPEMLVSALRATVAGTSASIEQQTGLDRLRAQVPEDHLDDFEVRVTEARVMNRLRDERGAFSDGWATGLARRALLEAGRRLAAEGKLRTVEDAADLDAAECAALLRGHAGPSADEVAKRVAWRTSHTIDDAPPFLRARPAPPPPVGILPLAARRAALAVDAVLTNLFGVPAAPAVAADAGGEVVLRGQPVNSGVYEGPARLVEDAADFGRIQQGDVLVTRMTSPYFNVVLPLLGAIVTDRGGQLCHAAIVAREYGIPGIVGTREATARITDGMRVRVDGASGEVRLLG